MSKYTVIARVQRGNVLQQFRIEEDDFETCITNLRKAMATAVADRLEPTSPPVVGEAS